MGQFISGYSAVKRENDFKKSFSPKIRIFCIDILGEISFPCLPEIKLKVF